MSTLGWDIGGAHLKAARCAGNRITRTWLEPCPLWRDLDALRGTLESIARQAGPVDLHAITMTGELSDIFPDREQGVRHLLATFAQVLPGAMARVYAHPGRWLTPSQAQRRVRQVASVNWSASAAWLAQRARHALFVDIGSTTTDLVPVVDAAVAARGTTDRERLAHDELVYQGVVRTPVMAMAARIPHQGEWIVPMAESFATSADVYRLLGLLPAGADRMPSADGRGKTRLESARRLGRMLGVDAGGVASMMDCAHYLTQSQLWLLHGAALRVLSGVMLPARAPVIGAGVGRFLARQLALRLGRPYRDMEAYLPAQPQARLGAADCAPAACVALLADRHVRD